MRNERRDADEAGGNDDETADVQNRKMMVGQEGRGLWPGGNEDGEGILRFV
jgi:hypothetical protein